MQDPVDMNGKPLAIGDRVYVAPRSYGGKGDVCVQSPVFTEDGEEILKMSIRGRIIDFHWSDKHSCAIVEVDRPTGGSAVTYPELCRKQAGRTKAEKTSKYQGQRADALKQIGRNRKENQK